MRNICRYLLQNTTGGLINLIAQLFIVCKSWNRVLFLLRQSVVSHHSPFATADNNCSITFYS